MSKGFTLLEMTISLLIAAIALTVIYQALGKSLALEGNADQVALATMVAQSKLAELSASEPIQIGTMTGVDQTGIRWETVTTVQSGVSSTADARVLVAISVKAFDRPNSTRPPILTLRSITYAVTQ